MIILLIEIDKYKKVLSYKEGEFEKVNIYKLNKWIDDKVKFGILTNSDFLSIYRYGGAVIRNGAILIKNRKKTYRTVFGKDIDVVNTTIDIFLTEVEGNIREFKLNRLLN